jgi:hypothetical protein
MEYQKPSIVFEDKNIRSVSFRAPHLLACSSSTVLEARDPGDRSLHLNGDFRNVDPHECGVPGNLFPTRADVFPSRQTAPARMDTNRAGIGRPYFIHEVDIETLESEVELEIRFDNLFGISHRERLCITETTDKLAADSISNRQFIGLLLISPLLSGR